MQIEITIEPTSSGWSRTTQMDGKPPETAEIDARYHQLGRVEEERGNTIEALRRFLPSANPVFHSLPDHLAICGRSLQRLYESLAEEKKLDELPDELREQCAAKVKDLREWQEESDNGLD